MKLTRLEIEGFRAFGVGVQVDLDAIGPMSQAPRHSKPRTPMSSCPSAALHICA